MYRSFRCHIQPGLGLTYHEAYFLRMCRDTSPRITVSAHVSPRAAANIKLTGISAVSSVTAVRNNYLKYLDSIDTHLKVPAPEKATSAWQ
jgi:hypothetical protein